jgi:hypothetical protein
MTKVRAVLIAALVVSAIFIPSASTASASTYVVTGLEGCIYVPGRGGFEPGCRVASAGAGNWARAIISESGLLYACLYVGLGLGMLADPGCIFLGGMRLFAVFADPPALTVKIKGGPFKFKGTLAGVKVGVECTKLEAKEPEIASDGKTTAGEIKAAALRFSACTVPEPATQKCSVAEPIETKPVLTKLVENGAETKVESVLQPQSGATVAELTFSSCKTAALDGTYAVDGTALAEGGAEDERSKFEKDKVEEGLGTEEDGEAVEKPKLNFEALSKEYLNDENGTKETAGLTLGGNAATVSGEATIEAEFGGGLFTDSENSEKVEVSKEAVDLGVDKE